MPSPLPLAAKLDRGLTRLALVISILLAIGGIVCLAMTPFQDSHDRLDFLMISGAWFAAAIAVFLLTRVLIWVLSGFMDDPA